MEKSLFNAQKVSGDLDNIKKEISQFYNLVLFWFLCLITNFLVLYVFINPSALEDVSQSQFLSKI